MENMITIKEAAEILGVKHSTINGWMFKKTMPFPFYRLNTRCIRFKKQEILDYIEKAKSNE